ncbi:hypothetical protein U1Q18_014501 [Sarracenia purpurea var. burkii]
MVSLLLRLFQITSIVSFTEGYAGSVSAISGVSETLAPENESLDGADEVSKAEDKREDDGSVQEEVTTEEEEETTDVSGEEGSESGDEELEVVGDSGEEVSPKPEQRIPPLSSPKELSLASDVVNGGRRVFLIRVTHRAEVIEDLVWVGYSRLRKVNIRSYPIVVKVFSERIKIFKLLVDLGSGCKAFLCSLVFEDHWALVITPSLTKMMIFLYFLIPWPSRDLGLLQWVEDDGRPTRHCASGFFILKILGGPFAANAECIPAGISGGLSKCGQMDSKESSSLDVSVLPGTTTPPLLESVSPQPDPTSNQGEKIPWSSTSSDSFTPPIGSAEGCLPSSEPEDESPSPRGSVCEAIP